MRECLWPRVLLLVRGGSSCIALTWHAAHDIAEMEALADTGTHDRLRRVLLDFRQGPSYACHTGFALLVASSAPC